jgi:hypothetical protein
MVSDWVVQEARSLYTKKRKFVFLIKVITLILLMFNFMKLAAHQHCTNPMSDYSKVLFSTEFVAQKI